MAALDVKTIIEGNAIFNEFKGTLTEQYVMQQLRLDSRCCYPNFYNRLSQRRVDGKRAFVCNRIGGYFYKKVSTEVVETFSLIYSVFDTLYILILRGWNCCYRVIYKCLVHIHFILWYQPQEYLRFCR